jgi:simple sugar transport system substrate-binding protein
MRGKRFYLFVLVCLVLVSMVSCGPAATPTPAPPVPTVPAAPTPEPTVSANSSQLAKLDAKPRIAVESAFDAELQLLLAQAEVEEKYVILGHTFTTAKLAGNDVVLFLSGVSMVNAALTTQVALDNFNVTHIVFSGIAGGVNPDLHIGDVVAPKQWGQYLEAYFARETEKGVFTLPSWVEPQWPNFGMIYPSPVEVVHASGDPDAYEEKFWFPVDPEMLAVAEKVAAAVDLAQCTQDNVCLSYDPVIKADGNGVSGQAFIDNAAFRDYAWETFQADALDMETAAVAMVAYTNDTPYLAFRSLSDLAGGGPGENEIGTFFQLAADNSATVVLAFLEAWATGEIPPTPEKFLFGVILVGPYNDHGWSEAHYVAGKYVEAKIPGAQMIYVDNVNPAAKPGVTVPQVVDGLIQQGARIIFTTSDDFKDGTLEAAKQHPDVPIVNVSGDHAWKEGKDYQAPANESNFMGRMEYGKMIAGCVAALTTQTGKIGYLGPLINDETRRLASSAYLGARYCWANYLGKDPATLQFKVTWIGFWFNIPGQTLDPTQVADDFYNSGYDVVLSGIDTTQALVEADKMAAQGKKVWALQYDYKDGCQEAPAVCLGAPYFNWGPAYLKAVTMVMDNQWTQYWDWNGPDWNDINNPDTSAVGFAKGQALSADASAKLDTFIRDLGNGSINLFKGPLNFQDGSTYLMAGQVATDLQIWYLPQLLQGMEGVSK